MFLASTTLRFPRVYNTAFHHQPSAALTEANCLIWGWAASSSASCDLEPFARRPRRITTCPHES
jgi:hypothetical protein